MCKKYRFIFGGLEKGCIFAAFKQKQVKEQHETGNAK